VARSDRPRLSRRLLRTLEAAAATYVRIAGGQRAAAISYRVLFSLVPFVALLVSVLELVLPETTQQSVVSWLVGVASLPEEFSQSVDAAVKDAGPPASATGAVALVGLIWAASGMMASIRSAFRAVWDSEADRPYLRGKLVDFVLVLGAGVMVVSAFGLSLVVQVVTETSSEIAAKLGSGESATAGLGAVAQLGASLLLALLAFTLLYRVVPPVPVKIRDVVPGAVVAAVGVHLASAGFSLYLSQFGGFNNVFGPLGAILAFLLLVYAAAAILLVGACVAAAWPDTATESASEEEEPVALRTRLVRAARGLVIRDRSQ
jgi:membrane protein